MVCDFNMKAEGVRELTDGASVFSWPSARAPGPQCPSPSLPQSLWASTTVIVFSAKQLAALKIYLVML